MRLVFKKRFIKQYAKLSESDKFKVNQTLNLFELNPKDRKLRNHALKGVFSGLYSVDASFDLRLVFREENNYLTVYFVRLGTHSELYG